MAFLPQKRDAARQSKDQPDWPRENMTKEEKLDYLMQFYSLDNPKPRSKVSAPPQPPRPYPWPAPMPEPRGRSAQAPTVSPETVAQAVATVTNRKDKPLPATYAETKKAGALGQAPKTQQPSGIVPNNSTKRAAMVEHIRSAANRALAGVSQKEALRTTIRAALAKDPGVDYDTMRLRLNTINSIIGDMPSIARTTSVPPRARSRSVDKGRPVKSGIGTQVVARGNAKARRVASLAAPLVS